MEVGAVLRGRLWGGGCSIKGQALGRCVQGREYQGAGLWGGGCRVGSIKGQAVGRWVQALGRWVQGREYQGAGSGEVGAG